MSRIAETAICAIALSKKNRIFLHSEGAGQRVAVIQTLLGKAKFKGIWQHGLEIPLAMAQRQFDRLLPFECQVEDANER